jgi:predicted  nucleic acid-binding Zn-ribbon protein
MIAVFKADKESLEHALYEAQQMVAQLESKKEQLEAENQDLLSKKENLLNEVAKLNKELDAEVEKGARNREALNQKIVQLEQDSLVLESLPT